MYEFYKTNFDVNNTKPMILLILINTTLKRKRPFIELNWNYLCGSLITAKSTHESVPLAMIDRHEMIAL